MVEMQASSGAKQKRWEEQNEAILGARDVDTAALAQALEQGLAQMGFLKQAPPERDPAKIGSLLLYRSERAAYLCGRWTRALTRGLAARTATHFGASVELFHVHVRFRENKKPACHYDVYEASVDAAARFGPVDFSIIEQISLSDEELDSDKPWRVANHAMLPAFDTWIPNTAATPVTTEIWHWAEPEPLAEPRLDGIVVALRSGARVEFTSVANQSALRVRELDGTTSIFVLSEEQLALLRQAWPALGV
jgi:hypothetical protein